ncbi:hypothetical protein SCLCIDRAFT_107594 [Scleroderma citrinum Foug A]|uniref:Uncharacterized protein n=1 Tax=Scleroderma citrinum Foug A TaxID=1036808 RepID=A0A0C3E4D6_9AGAM|nr:hypothetical protein SCLCIDRAFT_107594 [Scleroderma citrinum Foug A]
MTKSSLSSRASSSDLALICLGVLSAVTFLNVIFTLYSISVVSTILPSAPREYTWVGDDHPTQLPLELPEVGLVLEDGHPHFDLWDDDEWGTLFPSDGFARVGPHNRTFVVSLYHQFHCLDVIRVGYLVNRTHAAHHIQHCLRYLRQILLCHADTTLEPDIPQMAPDGSWHHTANGVGAVHRCRDWTKLRRYMLENPSLPFEDGYDGNEN